MTDALDLLKDDKGAVDFINGLAPLERLELRTEAETLLNSRIWKYVKLRLASDARAHLLTATNTQAKTDDVRVAQGGYLQASRDTILVESLVNTLARLRQKDS